MSDAAISIVIPTLNAAGSLPATLAALVPATLDGLVRELIVSDGGSSDETLAIADAAGAQIVTGAKGRGGQLARGAAAARGNWLLFVHADTVLEARWANDAQILMRDEECAGVFTLAFDVDNLAARVVAGGAMIRARLFAAPYGDQGLLISRSFYSSVGGFSENPLFEDVEMIDRIVRHGGRRALRVLSARAVTSAARYRSGYFRRVVKNAACLAMYRLGVAPERISKFYHT